MEEFLQNVNIAFAKVGLLYLDLGLLFLLDKITNKLKLVVKALNVT